jgi:abhydrolase domain-containing protein 17
MMKSTFKRLVIGEFSWRRVRNSLVLIPVCVYLGLLVIGTFFADKVIFRPPYSSYKNNDLGLLKLSTASGESIGAKYYPSAEAKYTILFSHGNAEDIGHTEPFIGYLRDSGFNVMTYDYRGYGTSEGTPSEQNAYEDIDVAYRYLTEELRVPPNRIILHGRSLGGAVAVDLASREPVAGLIMESTFTSAFRVVTRWSMVPFDRFDSIGKMPRVRSPVLIIHGKRDRTIAFHHGEELFAAAPGVKYSLWTEDAGHNDLFNRTPVLYLKTIKEFSENLQ